MKKVIIGKLDKVWSELIKLKDGNKCKKCGKVDGLSSHHIFGRRKFSTRWDLDNGITLCDQHHTKDGSFSAHLTPKMFEIWLKIKIGKETYEQLEQRSNSHYHWTDPELEEMLEIMSNSVKSIKKLL